MSGAQNNKTFDIKFSPKKEKLTGEKIYKVKRKFNIKKNKIYG